MEIINTVARRPNFQIPHGVEGNARRTVFEMVKHGVRSDDNFARIHSTTGSVDRLDLRTVSFGVPDTDLDLNEVR